MSRRPLLVVTPHASGHVPQDVLGAMLGDARVDLTARARRTAHLFDEGDPYSDVIFDVPNAHALHATVSRFVVDLNRDRVARGRNGVVKATDFEGRPLYPTDGEPDDAEVEERLRRYWDPFHAVARRIIREHGIELLLVGHSMTPIGPAIGPDGGARRPALTLMTAGGADGEPADDGAPAVAPTAARALRDAAERRFAPILAAAEREDALPPRVALNDPWSVDAISRRHADATGISGFGLEINRALYLTPGADGDQPRPDRIAALRACAAEFATDALRIVRRHPRGGPR